MLHFPALVCEVIALLAHGTFEHCTEGTFCTQIHGAQDLYTWYSPSGAWDHNPHGSFLPFS